MSVGVWPMLMALITDEWRNKRAISRDVEDRLYSKAIYIFTKVSGKGVYREKLEGSFLPFHRQSTAYQPAEAFSWPTLSPVTYWRESTTRRFCPRTLTSSTSTLVKEQIWMNET